MIARYHRSRLMKCRVQDLYAFHLQTENAARIMPPGFTLLKLQAPHPPALHVPIRLTLRLFGLVRQTWVVHWEVMEPPQGEPETALLVDRTVQGPFPYFLHHHRFTQEGNQSRLTDDLYFQPPFRPLGCLLLPLLYLQFSLLFAWRQARTKTVLEAGRT